MSEPKKRSLMSLSGLIGGLGSVAAEAVVVVCLILVAWGLSTVILAFL